MADKTVDVLAVLRRHVALAEQVGCCEQQAEAWALFDAVAEMIEADREFDAAERELNDDTLTSDEKSAVSWPRYYAARERRAAALTRVGGAE